MAHSTQASVNCLSVCAFNRPPDQKSCTEHQSISHKNPRAVALQEAQQAKIRRRFTHDERAATTETNRRLLKEERERELRERAKEKVHSVRVAIFWAV